MVTQMNTTANVFFINLNIPKTPSFRIQVHFKQIRVYE